MKVLVAHNFYDRRSPSGENAVVENELKLLTSAGIAVTTLFRYSDRIGGNPVRLAEAAIGPLHSPSAVRELRTLVGREQPSVIHVHNVFPLISPSIVDVAARLGVPVVQSVHNYRHSCVNGLHFRKSQVCTDCCSTAVPWPAVVHGCYRQSRLQTVPMAVSQSLHRRTWRGVAHTFALTPFMADRLVAAGIPRERISLRPSWVADPGEATEPPTGDFAYVGRLDEAKGVLALLEAWRQRTGPSRRLVIAGDGPLAAAVQQAAQADPDIRFLGRVAPEAARELMRRSSAVLVPSLWFEGFPLTVVEAFSVGRPVVVTRGGSAASIVDDRVGWVTDATPEALVRVLDGWDDAEAARRGRAARTEYLRHYTAERAVASLVDKYEELAGAGPTGGSGDG